MKRLLCAAAAALSLAGGAMAAPISFTFTSTGADIDGGPVAGVDLQITFVADTNNYVPAPGGYLGGARYAGLSGTLSSVALGLTGVAITNALDVAIGAPAAGVPGFVGLSDGTALVGLSGFNSADITALANWDGRSDIAVSQLQTVTNTLTLNLNLAGGTTIGLIRLDGNGGPGPQDGAFSATLVTNGGTVPEPMTPALVLAALAAGGLVTRRRSA